MKKVLFVCIHNSARSQMAEAFLNEIGTGQFQAESAGLEAGTLNRNVMQVMQEDGIDISNNQTKAVINFLNEGRQYDAVVTVCDAVSAERCPIFPGKTKRIAWSFPDPSRFKGTQEEILVQTRNVRDEIKDKVSAFIQEANHPQFWI
ncbi:MAG TPA: arsenate reductase ArsC [Flavipsychrobacter sp.]|nr:arsenate reductase ArsC [Flavipsychrobacter sp.]